MKKLVFSLAIVVISFASKAQKNSNVSFNVGAELGLATGNLNTVYSIGIGATAQLEYKMDENANLTVNSGIIEYVGKKISGSTTKFRSSAAIPVLAGVKYYFASNFYGAAQLGVTIFSGVGGSSKFTYSPGLGFKVNEKADVLLKYTGYSDAGGAFGIRVGYTL